MLVSDKIYVSLCAFFSVLLVVANLIYQKFVSLPLLPFYTFELSIGVLLYPLTFFITDLIVELYGKEKAHFCVKLGIVMNIIVGLVIIGMDALKATDWSHINDDLFHKIFGFYNVAFIGSILACYSAQAVDIFIYSWIRKLTKNKWLWLRSTVSTSIALLIDTSIVISFMTAFGVLPVNRMGILIMNSYLFKLFFIVCSTPLFYGVVGSLRRLLTLNSKDAKLGDSTPPKQCAVA